MVWTYLRACYKFNMRLWVGGQEVIYPARWFFCDPNAKIYPSPHGAEASPWLKQYERNLEWGDDGTLKQLDRGINPGYPGLCSVGDPQWFIDGHLPESVLTPLPPPTPACCGYTPPYNPDPRCPAFCEAIACPFSEDHIAYFRYKLSIAGATGDFAICNGDYIMQFLEEGPDFMLWAAIGVDDTFLQATALFFEVAFTALPPIGSGNQLFFSFNPPYLISDIPFVVPYLGSIGIGSPGTATLTCA